VAALLPEKKTCDALNRRLSGPHRPLGYFGEEKTSESLAVRPVEEKRLRLKIIFFFFFNWHYYP
jgi:hypothetical protein